MNNENVKRIRREIDTRDLKAIHIRVAIEIAAKNAIDLLGRKPRSTMHMINTHKTSCSCCWETNHICHTQLLTTHLPGLERDKVYISFTE